MINYILGLLVTLGVVGKAEPTWEVEQKMGSNEVRLTMVTPVMHTEETMLSSVEDTEFSPLFHKVMDMCGSNQTLSVKKPQSRMVASSMETKTSDIFNYSCEFKEGNMVCKTVVECLPVGKSDSGSGL